jgi:hypothetical protein
MDLIIVQPYNCGTCNSNIVPRCGGEMICEIFNSPVEMYEGTTMKYGCNSYVRDDKKMAKLPEETKIKGRHYIRWDVQYSEPNAQISAATIKDRIPKSVPEIIMMKEDNKEPIFGIYVLEDMS